MKRIICLILVSFMLLSVIACKGGNEGANALTTLEVISDVTVTGDNIVTDAPEEPAQPSEPTEPKEPSYPFYAGYARVDITPEYLPVPLQAGEGTMIADNLYATVVAVSDGESNALFITLDLQYAAYTPLTRTFDTAEKYGVPKENVFVSATHNHSGVHYDDGNDTNLFRWKRKYYDAIDRAIREALDDLTLTTAEIGRGYTKNFAFVRRYYMKDGSFRTIGMPTTNAEYDRHESEADTELQAIRFVREGAKDIVMVNWQAHTAHAVGFLKNTVTSDYVHNFRKGSEAEYDVHFAFFQGGCGNINLTSYIPGRQIYKNYLQVGNALVGVLGEALESAEPALLGEIRITKKEYGARVDHSEDHLYDKALEAYNAWRENSSITSDEMFNKYGFYSVYHASAIIIKKGWGATVALPITAISFGELGFASTPYEMFDTNAMQIKEGSPYKMTFVCAYTNGSFGYVPSTAAYDNGGYEVYSTRFVKGTGDGVASTLLYFLKTHYNEQQKEKK